MRLFIAFIAGGVVASALGSSTTAFWLTLIVVWLALQAISPGVGALAAARASASSLIPAITAALTFGGFDEPLFGVAFLALCLVGGLAMWVVEAKPTSRPCPVCGEPVPNGTTVCPGCRHDFRAAASAATRR